MPLQSDLPNQLDLRNYQSSITVFTFDHLCFRLSCEEWALSMLYSISNYQPTSPLYRYLDNHSTLLSKSSQLFVCTSTSCYNMESVFLALLSYTLFCHSSLAYSFLTPLLILCLFLCFLFHSTHLNHTFLSTMLHKTITLLSFHLC